MSSTRWPSSRPRTPQAGADAMPAAAPPLPPLPAPPRGLSRYAALAQLLRAHIVGGQWPAGSAIPAEQALATTHGVALGTMRQALQLLVDEGLIERRQGRGSFVRAGLAGASMLRFFRFSGGSAADASAPPRSQILSRRSLAASAEVAAALGLPRGAPALRLLRLRHIAGQPRLLEQIWLPLPRFAALADGDTAGWGDLLYPMYAQRCGVQVQRAEDTIGFGSLDAAQARHLGLPEGHPCASVTRLAFDLAGACVEWRTTRGDAHAFHYRVSLF